MLAYKYGTARLGLESACCCKSLQWLGLRADHVTRRNGGGRGDGEGGVACGGVASSGELAAYAVAESALGPLGLTDEAMAAAAAAGLPADAFQPFTSRDGGVLAGLARRAEVAGSADLTREVATMTVRRVKVEIEALYAFGFRYLSSFIEQRILMFDVEREEEHAAAAMTDSRALRGGGSRRRDGAMRSGGASRQDTSIDGDYEDEQSGCPLGSEEEQEEEEEEAVLLSEGNASSSLTPGTDEFDDDRFLLEEPPDW